MLIKSDSAASEKGGQEMQDLGVPELMVILVIVIILFGPSRLTGVGAALGQAIRQFRQGLDSQDVPKQESLLPKLDQDDINR